MKISTKLKKVNFDINKNIHKPLLDQENEKFFALYLYGKFIETGILKNANRKQIKEMEKILKITPVYKKFFWALMNILEKHKFIKKEKDQIVFKNYKFNKNVIQRKKEEILKNYPSLAKLIFTSLDNIFKVISGKLYYTEVLFPGGSSKLVDDFYKEFNGDFAMIGSIINNYIYQSKNKKIKIMEIGGGSGVTSEIILKRINSKSNRINYYFTDVSNDLLKIAKQKLEKKFDFIKFLKLDIENYSITKDKNSYDIITASNIIHATSNIESTLNKINNLLKPEGIFILNELTENIDYFTLTFGLTTGWWKYEDDKIRIKNSPLLSKNNWLKKVKECGFVPVEVYGKYGQKIFVLQKQAKEKIILSSTRRSIEHIQNKIKKAWSDILDIENIYIKDNFFELGGDSLTAVSAVEKINKELNLNISVTTIFSFPTIQGLSEYILNDDLISQYDKATIINQQVDLVNNNDIAIIGCSGIFPGANNIEELWQNLKKGKESISFYSKNELIEAGINETLVNNKNYIRATSQIENINNFDNDFFGYTSKQARFMDPQIRLFHQVSWEALESSGVRPSNYPERIGVFAGIKSNPNWFNKVLLEYKNELLPSDEFELMEINNHLAHHIAHKIGAKGPAITLDTGSSTSLVAIHLACKSILNKECDVALAGGVYLSSYEKRSGYLYEKNLMLSPDGHSRSFDCRARGTMWGSGLGVVVLKKLSDSLSDGDNVLAVIKGSAINNDGDQKANYSTPSVEGQSRVIKQAIEFAQINPESISYIEAHGTATPLGDPIEFESLKKAFNTNKRQYCAIGSIKTNFGHLSAAAGVAGLIKTVLSLQNKLIPPHLNYTKPNTHINLRNSPFFINTKLTDWNSKNNTPRRAGVSSFGIGGTNAHVILEEAPNIYISDKGSPFQLILLSARTKEALNNIRLNLIKYLKNNPNINLADISYTLKIGRKEFEHKAAFICPNSNKRLEKLLAKNHQIKFKKNKGTFKQTLNKHKLGKIGYKDFISELAQLWLKGEKIDWRLTYSDEKRKIINLPTYPFESREHKLEEKEKNTEIKNSFYLPVWKIVEKTKDQDLKFKNSSIIIFTKSKDKKYLNICKYFKSKKCSIITIEAGKVFKKINNNHYQINPDKDIHYRKVFNFLARNNIKPRMVIHLLSMSSKFTKINIGQFDQAQKGGLLSVLKIARGIKTLLKTKELEKTDLVLITDNVMKLGDEKNNIMPEKSTLIAAVKTIPQEYPFLKCKLLDFDNNKNTNFDNLFKMVLNCKEKIFICRQNKFFVPDFDKFIKPIINKKLIKTKGTYLIFGGIGGIGYTLAKYLIEDHQANLIIFERKKINPNIQIKINELKRGDNKIDYYNIDITNFNKVNSVIKKYSKINGIIHAAGELDRGGNIFRRDIDQLSKYLKTKAGGAISAEEIAKNKKSDFIIFCSSQNSIITPGGGIGYAASNIFLDYYAQSLRDKSINVMSINWPAWKNVGMAAENISKIDKWEKLNKKYIESSIDPKEGKMVFDYLLRESLIKNPQIIVSKINFSNYYKEYLEQKHYQHPLASKVLKNKTKNTKEKLTNIWKKIFGVKEINPNDNFFELGGDSLIAIQMVSRIKNEMNKKISVNTIFLYPTLKSLNNHIDKQ